MNAIREMNGGLEGRSSLLRWLFLTLKRTNRFNMQFRVLLMVMSSLYLKRGSILRFGHAVVNFVEWLEDRGCESCFYKSVLDIEPQENRIWDAPLFSHSWLQNNRNDFNSVVPQISFRTIKCGEFFDAMDGVIVVMKFGSHAADIIRENSAPIYTALCTSTHYYYTHELSERDPLAYTLTADGFYQHLKSVSGGDVGLKTWIRKFQSNDIISHGYIKSVDKVLSVASRADGFFEVAVIIIKLWLMNFRFPDSVIRNYRSADDKWLSVSIMSLSQCVVTQDIIRVVSLGWNNFISSVDNLFRAVNPIIIPMGMEMRV